MPVRPRSLLVKGTQSTLTATACRAPIHDAALAMGQRGLPTDRVGLLVVCRTSKPLLWLNPYLSIATWPLVLKLGPNQHAVICLQSYPPRKHGNIPPRFYMKD
ncbi:hypothetical protein BT67DRAFT_122865 [Trichocladium antarcticum]|uniref:Uncharacterized protein n=1 Tax=Trichocladium antarcticum TaxID=1450529 RepID=A0AAN6URF3_9PEZI|nr:hypothetical protein BT67DRAFT_122865 [Trichocladium antarcticum]